jgi:hypothetical protein
MPKDPNAIALFQAARQLENVIATLEALQLPEYSTHVEVLKDTHQTIILNLHKINETK